MILKSSVSTVGWKLARHLLGIIATVLIGAFVAAALVRVAPGFDVDDQQLDPRLNHASRDLLRSRRAQNGNIAVFYGHYLSSMVRGDLGQSQTLGRPVRGLLAERLPVTARVAGLGLIGGWFIALTLAVIAAACHPKTITVGIGAAAGVLLCIPSAVLAMAFVFANAPAWLAIALIVLPKVFGVTRNLLVRSYAMPHVLTARAKGISEVRVLLWHVLPATGGQVIALAGVSVALALGATIPVEALCGVPGIGQLAWQAALGRDLPLLVVLTMIVALITISANSLSDLANLLLGAAQV